MKLKSESYRSARIVSGSLNGAWRERLKRQVLMCDIAGATIAAF